MSVIKRITVSGFRGVLAKLSISFEAGAKLTSVVLYGRNGTGKSSLTDAWEWFRTKHIDHLAREGAKEPAFPHRAAKKGESFVEVEFADPALGTVMVEFDHDKITKPTVSGNHDAFCDVTPHPCHVRFNDLTQFVYQTKADRYDTLARLMGFQPQVDFQKGLRRVQKSLEQDLDSATKLTSRLQDEVRELTASDKLSDASIVECLAPTFVSHGISSPASRVDAATALEQLKGLVQRDPAAQQLASLRQLDVLLSRVPHADSMLAAASEFLSEAVPYRDQEEQLKKLLLVGLYEQGLEVLRDSGSFGQCPLCGQDFEGDLSAHVQAELDVLKALKQQHVTVEARRQAALASIPKSWPSKDALANAASECGVESLCTYAASLAARLDLAQEAFARLEELLRTPASELTVSVIGAVREVTDSCRELSEAAVNEAEALRQGVLANAQSLEQDTGRRALVEDYDRAAKTLDRWAKARESMCILERLVKTHTDFTAAVEDFVERSLADVQARFALISTDVTSHFEMLEKRTPGVEKPVLRLMLDQDRAVVPEVLFHGDAVAPAYKYLSESQLNSFGLAVFLASVRRFNSTFRFIILDDVVNSLDGYKRPQLIEILKSSFSDFQILLLTHDSVWRDRIYREFPGWRRINFVRHDYGIGPIRRDGNGTLDEVRAAIADDQPRRAGQILGPFIEGQLQEIAESFEIELKYNRRNEYTLEPLLDGVRLRAEKKLGKDHPLSQRLVELKRQSGFRNLSAHAKDPEIELTPQELQDVVDVWSDIETRVRCPDAACGRLLTYVDPGFRCACGKTTLVKPVGPDGKGVAVPQSGVPSSSSDPQVGAVKDTI